HLPHRSVSFRLGIATNTPLVPSMIFKSRTTKALSKVTEQNASSRSLFSSHNLMRTSVMTTAVLLQAGAMGWRVRTTRTRESGSPGSLAARNAAAIRAASARSRQTANTLDPLPDIRQPAGLSERRRPYTSPTGGARATAGDWRRLNRAAPRAFGSPARNAARAAAPGTGD